MDFLAHGFHPVYLGFHYRSDSNDEPKRIYLLLDRVLNLNFLLKKQFFSEMLQVFLRIKRMGDMQIFLRTGFTLSFLMALMLLNDPYSSRYFIGSVHKYLLQNVSFSVLLAVVFLFGILRLRSLVDDCYVLHVFWARQSLQYIAGRNTVSFVK